MKITTIVFDMDGTVMNTLEDLTVSMNYCLSKYGFPERKLEDYRRFFGNGVKYAMQQAVPEGTSEELIDQMLVIFKEHYDVHCLDKTCPYDGILDAMKALYEAGYKMAIVSNKIDSAVKELNERFFSDYVKVAIGERDGVKRKPAPDMVYEALKEMGSSKEESIYIGDSEVDLKTAENSGLPCIAVLWGFRDKSFLIKNGASVFANAPDDLYSIIKEFEPPKKAYKMLTH